MNMPDKSLFKIRAKGPAYEIHCVFIAYIKSGPEAPNYFIVQVAFCSNKNCISDSVNGLLNKLPYAVRL
jgi:hypothetical protein